MSVVDLRGFTVAVTADRRRDEQTVLLERLGLEVLMFPLLRTEAVDHGALQVLTEKISRDPPDYLLANTGYGMRTWFGMAADWDLRDALVNALGDRTQIAARGAKALGELRKVGLDAFYRAPGETLDEVVDRLLQEDLSAASVVVQLHGEPSGPGTAQLEAAGAGIVCLPVYRMGTAGTGSAGGLLEAIVDGLVDVVTFTAAPQVEAMVRAADERGVLDRLLEAFNARGVAAACIGNVCATAARLAGISEPLVPEHPRLGSLASAVASHLSGRQPVRQGEHGPLKWSGRLVDAGDDRSGLGPEEQRALRQEPFTPSP